MDFYIYAILELDILIGHPLENLIQEKPSHGGLDEKLGTTASATPIPCLESSKVNQQPNHNPLEEVKLVSLFISPKLAYETERASSPSLEPKPCPSGFPNTILEKENLCAMDTLLSSMCFHKDPSHLSILISKLFRMMVVDAFVYHKYCKSHGCTVALTLQLER